MGRGLNMEHFPSGLNISNIFNISPVLSTFLGNIPKKIEHIEHFPCFRHFLKFHPLFSDVWASVSPTFQRLFSPEYVDSCNSRQSGAS